jgi:hypothetical protein
VECKVIDADGSATGWQTKYVFDIESLLRQTQPSLETALSVHADLTRYVICFPFDLTGKTKRKGKSQTEKFDEWARNAEADAKAKGRTLTIERRPAHDIRDLVLANDPSGGLRHYFFSATTFSEQWFANHVAAAKVTARPRYNREISLQTPLLGWFSSFGEGAGWQAQLADRLDACRKGAARVGKRVEEKGDNSMQPGWPETVYDKGKKAAADSQSCIQSAEVVAVAPTEQGLSTLQASIARLLDDLAVIDRELAADLDAKHGKGSADSKQFRSYMAEYMVLNRPGFVGGSFA